MWNINKVRFVLKIVIALMFVFLAMVSISVNDLGVHAQSPLPPSDNGVEFGPSRLGLEEQYFGAISMPEQSFGLQFLGQAGGGVMGVAISNDYAYLGDGPRLVVVDMVNPRLPRVVGMSAMLPQYVSDVVAVNSIVYVANSTNGLRIYDAYNPARLREIGFYDTLGDATAIEVVGNYAYVADGWAGLRIIDIANPFNPREVGFYDTPGWATGVFVSGTYAYVADGSSGVRVINVANPTNPVQTGFYDTPGYAYDVVVDGSYAYVADVGSGMRIINIADPSNPIEIGFFNTVGRAYGVDIAGRYVYLSDWTAGLRIIDVINPANPIQVGFTDESVNNHRLAVEGSYAFVADWSGGLRVIDVASPVNPFQVGIYSTVGYSWKVRVVGDLAYVADGWGGLRITDVSNAARPVEIGFVNTPGYAYDVAVVGNFAYVADSWNGGLRVINVSNPRAPSEVGHFDTPGSALGIAVAGRYAYMADGGAGLRILDISNPVSPSEVGFFDTPGTAERVAVAGNYAYVADGTYGMRVVNVANPTAPVEVGFWGTTNSVRDVAVIGGYAYLADESGGLRIINVSNPTNLTEIGFYDTPGNAWSVAIDRGYAYVADGYGGLRVISVANPAYPTEVGFFDTPHEAQGVAVSGMQIYVTDLQGGLIILHSDLLTPNKVFLPIIATYSPFMIYEPNNRIQQSWGPLLSDMDYRAYIHSAQDGEDFFYFDMSSPHVIDVWLDQIPVNSDFDLYLYDFNSILKGFSGEAGNRSEHAHSNGVVPAGRYYIRVRRVEGFSASQPYLLRVRYSTAQEWSDRFDQYATGSSMHGQGGWKGWDNHPSATAHTSSALRRSPPNSLRIEQQSDLVHQYSGFTRGVWFYTTWQFIPTDFAGVSYFIVLNQYTDRPGDGRNWSTQVVFDSTLNQVINTGVSRGNLPLVRGQWVELRLEIDLNHNVQKFYYNGWLLYRGTWTGEVGVEGAVNLAAVDLFANYATAIYYDDMQLRSMPSVTDDPGNDQAIDSQFTPVRDTAVEPVPHFRPGNPTD